MVHHEPRLGSAKRRSFSLEGNCAFCVFGQRVFKKRLFQNQPIAGMTAVLPIAAFLFDQTGAGQIVECALYRTAREVHVLCDGIHCGPAVCLCASAVFEVHIYCPRPMGEFIGRGVVKVVKIAHGITP